MNTTEPAPRAAIYARISEKVDRDKVADQVAQCRAHAAARGYEVASVFEDDGISALGGKVRPGFNALLTATAGGEFDVIVATEEERLARNYEEKIALQVASEAGGVTWDTIRDGFTDPSTDSGEFMSIIRAATGRIESKRKARRQVAANVARVDDGLPVPGRRRFGYEKGNRVARIEEAEQVQTMFREYLGGASIVSLGKRFGWTPRRVRDTLSNPAYAGWVVRRGERFEAHESVARLIEREDFEAVQAKLANNVRDRRPGGVILHVASGIATCGICGGPLTYRNSYLCLADLSHPVIKGEFLETRIRMEVVHALMLPGVSIGTDAAGVEIRDVESRTAALTAKRADILAGLDDESLGLTMADLKPQLAAIARQLAELDERRQELVTQSTAATMLAGLKHSIVDPVTHRADIGQAADVANQLGERYDALDKDRKRELIRGLIEVQVFPGRSPDRVEVVHLTEAGRALNEDELDELNAA